MTLRRLSKLFEKGNVCVCGERGKGKDMLFSNIINTRKLPYVSNVEYPSKHGLSSTYFPLDFNAINCGYNIYKDFMAHNLKPYKYPYPLGCDVYISDVGVYMPSQFCNELNRDYKHIPTYMALSRHLGECNVHINVQTLNRAWDKLREQSSTYITCLWCKVFKLNKRQLVIQRIRIHEKYQSCLDNVPVLHLPLSAVIGGDRTLGRLYKLNYEIQHGKIKEYTLIYFNKSSYDTHIFRTMLDNKIEGVNDEKVV